MCVCEQPYVWVYVSKSAFDCIQASYLGLEGLDKLGPVHPPVSSLVPSLSTLDPPWPPFTSVRMPTTWLFGALALPSGASSHPSSRTWLFPTLWFSI